MRRWSLGLLSLFILLGTAACSFYVTLEAPQWPGGGNSPTPSNQGPVIVPGETITATEVVTVTQVVTVTLPQPWQIVAILPHSELTTTYAATPTLSFSETTFLQINSLAELEIIGPRMSEAMPLLALAHTKPNTPITVTLPFGPADLTLYRVDPELEQDAPCITTTPWLWQEASSTTIMNTPAGNTTSPMVGMFSVPVNTSCSLHGQTRIADLTERADEDGNWLDFIVFRRPADNTVFMIRTVKLEGPGESGSGDKAKASFCRSLNCTSLYGRIVCFVIGC